MVPYQSWQQSLHVSRLCPWPLQLEHLISKVFVSFAPISSKCCSTQFCSQQAAAKLAHHKGMKIERNFLLSLCFSSPCCIKEECCHGSILHVASLHERMVLQWVLWFWIHAHSVESKLTRRASILQNSFSGPVKDRVLVPIWNWDDPSKLHAFLHISSIKVNATTPFQAKGLPQSGYHVNSISLKPPCSFRRKTNSFIKSGHLGIQTHTCFWISNFCSGCISSGSNVTPWCTFTQGWAGPISGQDTLSTIKELQQQIRELRQTRYAPTSPWQQRSSPNVNPNHEGQTQSQTDWVTNRLGPQNRLQFTLCRLPRLKPLPKTLQTTVDWKNWKIHRSQHKIIS